MLRGAMTCSIGVVEREEFVDDIDKDDCCRDGRLAIDPGGGLDSLLSCC